MTHYDMGGPLAIKGFAAAILGGLGQSHGRGGRRVARWGAGGRECELLAGRYNDVAAFAILLLVLFVRPHGLFGRHRRESVREHLEPDA